MKYHPILFLIIIACSCKTKTDNYRIETELIDCFYNQYQEHGIDVAKSIDSANSILIGFDIIPDNSGKSFIKLLEEIRENNGLPNAPSTELLDSLEKIKYLPISISCIDSTYIDFDSAEFYNSKLSIFFTIYDSIAKSGSISVKLISGILLDRFSEQDFDNTFYNTFGTLALCNLIKAQKHDYDFLKLPPSSTTNEAEYDDPSNDILEISMIDGDKLVVSDSSVDINSIQELVRQFVLKNGKRSIIKVKSKRSISYEFYIDALENIDSAYINIYNQESIRIHGTKFENISELEKMKIRDIYPKQISLTDPEF